MGLKRLRFIQRSKASQEKPHSTRAGMATREKRIESLSWRFYRKSTTMNTERNVIKNVKSNGPIGIFGSIFNQKEVDHEKIWRTQGQKWDKPTEESLQKTFNTWLLELSQNNPNAVQRWYKMANNDERELHIFGDASKDAFCAVVYVLSAVIEYKHVNFVMGKTGA